MKMTTAATNGAPSNADTSVSAGKKLKSALKEKLDDSLALYADVIRRPRFENSEIERVRASWLAGIKQEKTNPNLMSARVIAPLTYGAGHPYAMNATTTSGIFVRGFAALFGAFFASYFFLREVSDPLLDAYSKVAADSKTTLIVPSNMTETSALIASAMRMVQGVKAP